MSEEKGVRRRRLAGAVVATLTLAALLSGPCATWLQGRERWVYPRSSATVATLQPDAVYLVAGERDQDRRVAAVAGYVRGLSADGGTRIPVFTGHERACGPYSLAERRNLEVGEWALRKLGTLGIDARLVPGRFNGTDGEMAALAAFLRDRPELRTVALCTSAFHVRRVMWRLRRHAIPGVAVVVICTGPRWSDRAPWTVLAELGKMGRDAMGMSRAPILSRGPVRYPDDGAP